MNSTIRKKIKELPLTNQRLVDTYNYYKKNKTYKYLYDAINEKYNSNKYIKVIQTLEIKLDSKKYKQRVMIPKLSENNGYANFRIKGFDKCYIDEIVLKVGESIIDKYNYIFDKNQDNFTIPFNSISNNHYIPNLICADFNSCIYNIDLEFKFNELKKDMYLVYDIVEIKNFDKNDVLTLCNDHFEQELILSKSNKKQEFEININLRSLVKNIELKFFNNKNNKVIPDPLSINLYFINDCGKTVLPFLKFFNDIYKCDLFNYNIPMNNAKILIEYNNIDDDNEIYIDIKYTSYNIIKWNNGMIGLLYSIY